MNDFETLLRDSLRAVAESTPARRPAEPRRNHVVTIAAAAIAIAGVAGTVVVATRKEAPAPAATSPSGTPPSALSTIPLPSRTVLAPRHDLPGLQVTSTRVIDGGKSAEGTILAPDGTTIEMYVQQRTCPTSMGDCGRLGFDTRQLGGHTVTRVEPVGDETPAGTTMYLLHTPCSTVAITDTAATPWNPAISTFIETLADTEGAVTATVPTGWQSLGAGRTQRTHLTEFSVGSDQYVLMESEDTPLGARMRSLQYGTPREISFAGEPAWLMTGTAPSGAGATAIAFAHGANAVVLVSLTSGTEQQLIDAVTQLEPVVAEDSPPSVPSSAADVVTSEPRQPERGCGPSDLKIVPS